MTVTAALVALQGLALLALSVLFGVGLALSNARELSSALFVLLFALPVGLGLLAVARGLLGGKRWSRSPALVTQLFVVPVALPYTQGDRWYVGMALLGWSLALLALLLSPPLGAHLRH